jgi:hypothetical protein
MPKLLTYTRGETGLPTRMKPLFKPGENLKEVTICSIYLFQLGKVRIPMQSALPNKFWIVSSIPNKVNGFDITSSTAVLFLAKTVSFPAPVMITTGVRGELFLTPQAKATPSIPGIS